MEIIYVTTCNHKWGPTACCSKASKEARLIERKVCLMFDAGNLEWGEAVAGRETSCLNQWARAFIG